MVVRKYDPKKKGFVVVPSTDPSTSNYVAPKPSPSSAPKGITVTKGSIADYMKNPQPSQTASTGGNTPPPSSVTSGGGGILQQAIEHLKQIATNTPQWQQRPIFSGSGSPTLGQAASESMMMGGVGAPTKTVGKALGLGKAGSGAAAMASRDASRIGQVLKAEKGIIKQGATGARLEANKAAFERTVQNILKGEKSPIEGLGDMPIPPLAPGVPKDYWAKLEKSIARNQVTKDAVKASKEVINQAYNKATEKTIAKYAIIMGTTRSKIERSLRTELLREEAKTLMKKGLISSGFLEKNWKILTGAGVVGFAGWQVSGDVSAGVWAKLDNTMTQRAFVSGQILSDAQWGNVNPIDAYDEMKDAVSNQESDLKQIKFITLVNPRSWASRKMITDAADIQLETLNRNVAELQKLAQQAKAEGLTNGEDMLKSSEKEMKTWVDKVKEFQAEHPEGYADTGQFAPEDFTDVSTAAKEKDKLYWQENQLIENKQTREAMEAREADKAYYEGKETEEREYYAGQRQLDEEAEKEMRAYHEKRLADEKATEAQRQQFWTDYQANKEAYWEEYRKKKQEEAPSKLTFGLL